MKNMFRKVVMMCCLSMLMTGVLAGNNKKMNEQVLKTMKTATQFMMDKVSYNGGFVWEYLPDLSRSWGELEAKRTMAWIQPPGTPDVGHLLLDVYHATGDEYYYESAKKVANALIWGQLECGGWNYVFDFAGENSLKDWYATIGQSGWRLEEFQHYYGNATFDDGGTMAAAKFLLRMYVEKKDPTYLPSLEKCINFVLESQYPVGGWPQRYPLKYDHPFQGKSDYSSFITMNDDVIPEATDFLIQCYQALGRADLKEPVLRAMYLIVTLQQGLPYAGWADQYFVDDLKPAHGRSYEPRGVNTGTTSRAIRLLIEYYRLTGDSRFLSGIPNAINFIESVKLPTSEAAKWHTQPKSSEEILVPRFIHPETGEPQYVHRMGSNVKNGRYYINGNIENTIAHYKSVISANPSALRRSYEEVKKIPKEELTANSPFAQNKLVPLAKYYTRTRGNVTDEMVKELVNGLNEDGYWPSFLKSISNVYKPSPEMSPSNSSDYVTTMVGDEYDTSCFSPTEKIPCISVNVYVQNMMSLVQYLDKK